MAEASGVDNDETQPTEPNSSIMNPSSEPDIDYEAMNPTGVLLIKKLRENINAGPFLEPVFILI